MPNLSSKCVIAGLNDHDFACIASFFAGDAGAFVAINDASFPENLIESELFGYKRGAFSGALSDRMGLIEHADKGTLFLDEVAELSPKFASQVASYFAGKPLKYKIMTTLKVRPLPSHRPSGS